MQQLYSSPYAQHSFDPTTRTLYTLWFSATEAMQAHDFKKEMETWLSTSEECKPLYIYDYCVDFLYPINPDEQVWMAHLLNPGWTNLGVLKYAHIVPEEFITNLSVEQMFEEFHNMNLDNQFEIRHFPEKDTEEAKDWLKSSDRISL